VPKKIVADKFKLAESADIDKLLKEMKKFWDITSQEKEQQGKEYIITDY